MQSNKTLGPILPCRTSPYFTANNIPVCDAQLTVWVENLYEIDFAIKQLDSQLAPWVLKQNKKGRYALFVPTEKIY